MDFFERQDKARRGTKVLVAYFVAGVLALTVAVYLAVVLIFAGAGATQHGNGYSRGDSRPGASGIWNPQLFLGVAVGTLAVVLMGSAFKTAQLSGGGSKVAEELGGVPVNANTIDPQERKLLNVVEEMAIASGVPVPKVYILPGETGINAFAAGFSTNDAVIGVTRGAVQLLNRDELQGVIGHEFSHILNGDMRLNMRLMGYVFGILCLAIIGRLLLYTRGRKNPLPLLGLALIATGWIGVVFGRLIQAAVSRQREYLADASAVQFTRNPDGLASALKKIGGLAQGSRLRAPQAAEASHMFFGNGLSGSLFGMMSTHPPLEKRIRALDPSFDGKFPPLTLPSRESAPPTGTPGRRTPQAGSGGRGPVLFPPIGHPRGGMSGQAGLVPPVISVPYLMDNIGSPQQTHLRYAEALRSSFPETLENAAREASGAEAIIYGLLLSHDEAVRDKQLNSIRGVVPEFLRAETLRLLPLVRQVAVSARLPLVDLTIPTLRQLSRAQFNDFRAAVEKLVEADGEIDLFEYMLQKIVKRHLEPEFDGPKRLAVQYYSLRGLAAESSILLSALSHVGGGTEEEALAAFNRGAGLLSQAAQAPIEMLTPDRCGLDMIDKALERFSQAVPQIKKNVINACALTVANDGVIKETEAELLRAFADSLDCPMPPLLANA